MKTVVLMENSKHADSAFLNEHGLSLYFEHGGQRILFDTGASGKFIYNATLLGIDLNKVDTCVISHPHYDHTGGLKSFLDVNRHATVYLKSAARGDFYTKRGRKNERTGIEPEFFDSYENRLHFIDGDMEVAENVCAAGIGRYRRLPLYTSLMLEKRGDQFVPDTLAHELFIAVKTPDGAVVLTGCAHHGVLNVLMSAEQKFGRIAGVAGGFHFGGAVQGREAMKREPDSEVYALAKFLKERDIKKVYTGHCTGDQAFEKLAVLARVKRMRTGDRLEF